MRVHVASLLSCSRYTLIDRQFLTCSIRKGEKAISFDDTEALCFAARFISIANSVGGYELLSLYQRDQLTSKLDRCTAYRTCVHTSSPAWDLSKSKGRWNISVCQEPQTKTRSCSLRVEAHLRLPPSCLCSNHDSGNLTQITSYCSAANHFQLQ